MHQIKNSESSTETNHGNRQQELFVPAAKGLLVSQRLRGGILVALLLLFLSFFSVGGAVVGWQLRGASSSPSVSGGDITGATRATVIEKVRPSVVQIEVVTKDSEALGSGVIIDSRGYIVTNNHVVAGAQQVAVMLFDGTRLPAQIRGTDPADDLAVIRITPPSSPRLTVALLGDSSRSQVGESVLAIGSPLGITQTVTSGIVSAVGRTLNEQDGAVISNAIQTDAAINPGNSGGALVNMQGQVIGIPTLAAIDPQFKMPADGVGFAIPSNRVRTVLPSYLT